MKESEKALLPDIYELNPETGRYRKKKKQKSKKNEKVKDNFVSLPSPQMVQVATFDQPTKQQLELDQLRRDLIENKERLVQLEKAKENKEQVIQPVISSQPVVVTTTTTAKEIEKEKKEINVEKNIIKQKEQEEEEEEVFVSPVKIQKDKEQRLKTLLNNVQKKDFNTEEEVYEFRDNNYWFSDKAVDLAINKILIKKRIEQLQKEGKSREVDKINLYLGYIDDLQITNDNYNAKTTFTFITKDIKDLLNERLQIIADYEAEDFEAEQERKFLDPSSSEEEVSQVSNIKSSVSKSSEQQTSGSEQTSDPISEPEQNPEVGQQTNVSAEQTPIDPSMSVEVPKDKFSPKYHVNSIIFYFGSSNPQWDFVLQNNLDKLDISKEAVKKLSRDLVDSYGHRFLIDEVKSDGDKVELNELLQLQILFESSMIKRGSHALMKVSDLVKFQSKLAANNKPQQVPQVPQVIDGVADDAQQQQQVEQINNNMQKAIPEQTQTLQNVPINEIVTVTQSQLSADILEAYENKKTYDSGKPIITPKVHIPEEIIPMYLPDPEFSFGKRLKRKNKY